MTTAFTRVRLRLGLALLALLAVVAQTRASAAAPPDFSGTWLGATDVPDVGSVQVTLVIRKAQQAYAATISDSASLITKDTEVRDLTVDGDTISFWFPLASGETVSARLTIAQDTLTGAWTHESGQTGSLRFEKQT